MKIVLKFMPFAVIFIAVRLLVPMLPVELPVSDTVAALIVAGIGGLALLTRGNKTYRRDGEYGSARCRA